MSDEQPSTNAPTSWRDVYALVQDSEKRLTATITEGFNRQSQVSQDHEVRIRVLEADMTRDTANNKTVGVVASVTQRVVLLMMSVVSGVIAIAALLKP